MPVSDWIEKLGRTIFESPFGAADLSKHTPELAEIRLAVLDEVKAKSHRVSGRPVFPFNLIRVRLRGVPGRQSEVFSKRFLSDWCEQELRSGLARAKYRFPEDLQVEFETTPELPGRDDAWLSVDAMSRERPVATVAAQPRRARLVVLRGSANPPELLLNKTRTNIGRTVDVYRADGPSRRNDLAFLESNEVSRTVSREHAHIMCSKKTGECRLYNDRVYDTGKRSEANCGLWIIRDGLSRAVHRDSRGVRLHAGDEIHLGRAVVRFVMK
jgi:hypothetical protein